VDEPKLSLRVNLHVNGDPHDVPTGCTVAGLIDVLELGDRRVAVAVNRDVVPRSRFATHFLQADDHVEILEAVGGG
jgi:sulfur carrier protein